MVSVYPVLHFPHRIPSRRDAHSVAVIGFDPSKTFTSDPELLNSGVTWGSVGLQNLLMHCPYTTSIVISSASRLYSSSFSSVIAINSPPLLKTVWRLRLRPDILEENLPTQRPGLGRNWMQFARRKRIIIKLAMLKLWTPSSCLCHLCNRKPETRQKLCGASRWHHAVVV